MEDFGVLHADFESDHDSLGNCICIRGRAGLASIYERLHADDDICGHAFHLGTIWRRIPKTHVIRKRTVPSYSVPGVVGSLLYIMGRTFGSMDDSGGDHICVWDRNDVHELQGMVRRAISFFQGESPEQAGNDILDSGADWDDHGDIAGYAVDRVRNSWCFI